MNATTSPNTTGKMAEREEGPRIKESVPCEHGINNNVTHGILESLCRFLESTQAGAYTRNMYYHKQGRIEQDAKCDTRLCRTMKINIGPGGGGAAEKDKRTVFMEKFSRNLSSKGCFFTNNGGKGSERYPVKEGKKERKKGKGRSFFFNQGERKPNQPSFISFSCE